MLAIIPARGGSKGLPGKNIRLLNGKPLIAYTIEAALKSKYITEVFVSTDSYEIAEISKKFGAIVPELRPTKLSSDSARSIDVFRYVINFFREKYNKHYKEAIILQPTSPLRSVQQIDEAVELFYNKDADSVISCCQESHPISWHKYITLEGKFEQINNQSTTNRQEYRPTYYPNGAIYVLKTNIIFGESLYTDNSYIYLMERSKSVDIDTLEDFQYCEYLLNKA